MQIPTSWSAPPSGSRALCRSDPNLPLSRSGNPLFIKSNRENERAAALSCLLLCDSKVETVEWTDWAPRLSAP